MAIEKQFRGGTTAQMASFVGAEREITVDTTKDTLVVHDGTTAGGFAIAREDLSNVAVVEGATALLDGSAGIVPAPLAGEQEKFLRGDGTWQIVDAALTDAEVETAYNNQVAQVSAPEIADGTGTSVRRYAPADIVAILAAHAAAGPTGADGASAYEIAVANGFSGDETTWLASLVGATGPAGADGVDGTDGANGADGKTVLSGTIAPTSGDGVDGDFYINTTTYELYGPKTAGAWGTGTSLIGPTGAAGADGAAGATGADGASAYEIAVAGGFVGTEAAWLASLVGPKGDKGDTGAAGLDGADGTDGLSILNGTIAPTTGDGVDGDFYINTTTYELYGPKTAGAWGSATSLVGPKGDKGDTGDTGLTGADGVDGVDGVDGLSVLNGTVAPTAGDGVDGEFYINTTTSEIYGPKTAGAWGTGISLIGPTGADGAAGATGADGASAYEIAVAGGFVGTEAAWLASLVGPQGPAGADGVDGEPGPAGGIIYGINVFRSAGVATGGYYVSPKLPNAVTLTRVYAKRYGGSGGFTFALSKNGTTIYGPIGPVTTEVNTSSLSLAFAAGDEMVIIIEPDATVTGVWVEFAE